jgi:hypothetical protein
MAVQTLVQVSLTLRLTLGLIFLGYVDRPWRRALG